MAIPPWVALAIPPAVAAVQGVATSAFNAFQANKQMRFQERMSNTAHQREIMDLRASGLNPILSSKLGGSSSPHGSSAQASSPDVAGTAIAARTANQNIELLAAQANQANSAATLSQAQAKDVNMSQMPRIDLLIAQKRQALQTADLNDYMKVKINREIENLEVMKKNLELEGTHSGMDLDRARREQQMYKGKAGAAVPYLDKFGRVIDRFLGDKLPRRR